MQKKKEAEPVLVRLQRVSDARHSDDYSLNKALRAQLRVCYRANFGSYLLFSSARFFKKFLLFQNQKKRVAEEEFVSKKLGLGIRLLPATEEDAATAARMKFTSKFERNRKEKRALINAASIFPGSSGSSLSDKKRLELGSKRRKIKAGTASELLTRGFKPSSWLKSSVSSSQSRGMSVASRHL